MGLYAGFKTQNKRVIITIKSGQTIQLIPTEE
jgi:hypothetical protein